VVAIVRVVVKYLLLRGLIRVREEVEAAAKVLIREEDGGGGWRVVGRVGVRGGV
jgi:hypothetical protein